MANYTLKSEPVYLFIERARMTNQGEIKKKNPSTWDLSKSNAFEKRCLQGPRDKASYQIPIPVYSHNTLNIIRAFVFKVYIQEFIEFINKKVFISLRKQKQKLTKPT